MNKSSLLLYEPNMLGQIECEHLALVMLDTSQPMKPYSEWLLPLANNFRARLAAIAPKKTFYRVVTFADVCHEMRGIAPIRDTHLDLQELICEKQSRLFHSVEEVLESLLPGAEEAREVGRRLRVAVYVVTAGHDWGSWASKQILSQVSARCREFDFRLKAIGCGIDASVLAAALGFQEFGSIGSRADADVVSEEMVRSAVELFLGK